MLTLQDRQAFADLSIIIKMMPKNMREKININFINFVEQNKDTNYTSTVKPTVPIKNQKLSETTEALLALIYRDYLCSETKRKELIIAENQELKKIEDENRKNYDINFEKRNTNNTSLVEYKPETLLVRIINKLKRLFKFN